MHIRIQQRNGKKSLTTIQVFGYLNFHLNAIGKGTKLRSAMWECVTYCMKLQSTLAIELHTTQGLEKNFDYKKVLKAFKKGRSFAED